MRRQDRWFFTMFLIALGCFLLSLAIGELRSVTADATDSSPSIPNTTFALAPLQDIVQITAGGNHICVLTSSGGVKCWGSNESGQLGNNTTIDQPLPVDVVSLENGASKIVAGYDYTCALMNNGSVKCWGSNDFGQLGNNMDGSQVAPVEVQNLGGKVEAIAAGNNHICALIDSNKVKCWGANNLGQIGDGTNQDRSLPVSVSGLDNDVSAITTGYDHTCVATTSNKIKCWGNNDFGQLGDGTITNRSTPVDVVGLLDNIHKIVAGASHTCIVTRAGEVKCWGSNYYGQLGYNTFSISQTTPVNVFGLSSDVTMIAAGYLHTCAVKSNNGILCWGRNLDSQLGDGSFTDSRAPVSVVGIGNDVSAIAAGVGHTCTLMSNGEVKCWGHNGLGQLGDGAGLNRNTPVDVVGLSSNVNIVATGDVHTCILTSNGGGQCWGSNYYSQLGDGSGGNSRAIPVDVINLNTNLSLIAASSLHTCALTTNGGAKCWGDNANGRLGDSTTTDSAVPVDVSGLTSDVLMLALGQDHSCVLTSNGGVKCWGNNSFGELGDLTHIDRSTPVNVAGLTSGVAKIATGHEHTCAILTSGSVKCWGDNSFGQLGDGNTGIIQNRPTDVVGLSDGVSGLAAGYLHTCALLNNGSVRCWGDNSFGQLGDATVLAHSTPQEVTGLGGAVSAITAGRDHTCAQLNSGVIKCWGRNNYGQLGDGTITNRTSPVAVVNIASGVTALASGYFHTCAVINGEVKCWGWNWAGQLGNNTTWRTTPVDVMVASACSTLSLSHSGEGSDPTPTPANSAGCTPGQYVAGEAITLNATPANGWQLASWQGTANDLSTATSNSLTMPANAHSVQVHYNAVAPTCYPLTLAHNGSGSAPLATPSNSPGCATGQYNAGVSINLTARPAAGWLVVGWNGTASDASTSVTNDLTMPASQHTVSVTYAPAAPNGDAYEINNTCGEAHTITTDGVSQSHTFHRQADVDWVQFTATSGKRYLVEVVIPPASPADVALELYAACGAMASEGQDYAFSPGIRLEFAAPVSGPLFLKLVNHNPDIAGVQVRYDLAVRALEQTTAPGALILVAGALRGDDPVQANIYHVTDTVYQLFIDHGYTADRIYYLAPDRSRPHVDALATVANLQAAITQWASGQVGSERALTLYLMDHGSPDLFYLDKRRGEWVTPNQIDGWLSELEALHTDLKVNVIIEACYAGSFISEPDSLSRPGRVVITSTDDKNLAWASAAGARFSDHFLAALRRGASLYSGYREAQVATQLANAAQSAWLDGNGDRDPFDIGNQAIAAQRGFSFPGTFPDELWPPYIAKVEPPDRISNGRGLLRAEVRDDVKVAHVWAVVYPPGYSSQQQGEALVQEQLATVALLDQGSGRYAAYYDGFVTTGLYRIVFYADDNLATQARPVVIEVEVGNRLFLPVMAR